MLFTSELARDLQVKSAQARRISRIKRDNLLGMIEDLQAKLAVITTVTDKVGKPDVEVQAELDRLTKTLSKTSPTDPDYLRLVQAKATLYGLIHPKPGIAKPRRARAGLDLPPPKPVESAKPGSVPGTV